MMSLVNALPGAVAQGLIWGIMAIGVYLTFRILDIADLTVDGSLGTGGAVCIMLMLSGQNVWVSMAGATAAGMAAGLATGILHTFMGIPGNPGRNPDSAWPVFHQLENHGKSEPGNQCRQI